MAEFYGFPHWTLTLLVMATAFCILLQTLTISYSIRRLRTGWARMAENGMECAVLGVLLLFAALLAHAQYGLFGNFLLPSGYNLARQMIFLFVAALGTATAVGAEVIHPFFVVGGAATLLPMTEKITGEAYPFFFLSGLIFFLCRSGYVCGIRRRELYALLSSISVKEAIDTLPTGLLFFRPEGDILLCNHRMDILAQKITGSSLHSGKAFRFFLEKGELKEGCTREVLGNQQVFRLPDASVWNISLHKIFIKHRAFLLYTADDVTEQWDAVKVLAQQNQTLKTRGQELRHTIQNLQTICEAEEIARNKSRIHDILGQRISLLLRALRDNQQPNETTLMDFVHSLPAAFLEDSLPDPTQRLRVLKDTFRSIDVSVEIQGELPENREVAENFSQIAAECVTNAVRHGYATCVHLHFFQNDCYRMTVTDNGIPPAGPIREGGGITDMRRRIHLLGGNFELYTLPRFRIELSVPKEAVEK